MGGPRAPDPAEQANAQAKYNREAAYDSALINQIGQESPWARSYYTGGPPGDPNRHQVTTLAPEFQEVLDKYTGNQRSFLNIIDGTYGQKPVSPVTSTCLLYTSPSPRDS